jgi:fatty-acid desaturase
LIAAILYFITLYILAGIGTSLFYHRILCHRVLELQPTFEKILAFVALPAGTPVQWVGTHRKHHAFTDVKGDPHSPVLSGFWYAHCGWYIEQKNPLACFLYALGGPLRMLFDSFWRPRNGLENNHLASDLLKKPFYRWISKPVIYMISLWCYLLVLIIPAYLIWDVSGIAILWVSLIIIYNLGDSINSFGHLWGKRISSKNYARNNSITAFFTFGEGYHGEHHLHPSSDFPEKSKINISRIIIYIWTKLGLIKQRI